MQNFNIFSDNLLTGKNLIEASAGTGKTYSIALIFLRLLLEKDLKISEILTVTFTKAATVEMKCRIRNFINEAQNYLSGQKINNAEISKIIDKILKQKQKDLVINQLQEAKLFFDTAQIFTIHGFCQKVLNKYAFECNLNHQTELVPDETALIKETLEDFFRLYLVNTIPQFAEYLNDKAITPNSLTKMLINKINDPYLKINISSQNNLENIINKKIENLEALYKTIKILWKKENQEITNLLLTSPSLKRNIYPEKSILKIANYLNIYFDTPKFSIIGPADFERFTSSKIEISLKNNCTSPEHVFFDLLDDLTIKTKELLILFADYLSLKKEHLFKYLKEKLAEKKAKSSLFSYDDLISKTHTALTNKNRSKLRYLLNTKYKAILIDEFQDTNKAQYEIFNLISEDSQKPVYFIGDPKQAIYSFRGADVFAYFAASAEENLKPDKKFTMFTNFRATSNLVSAVNKIFSKGKNPFFLSEISFPKISAQKNEKTTQIPITIFHKFSPKPIPKNIFQPLIINKIAAEIIKLTQDNPNNKSIAVLVRKNSEALLVKQIFSKFKIPAILCKADNIFGSFEAQNLLAIANGVAKAYEPKFLKAALLTEPLGKDLNYLEMLNQNPQKLEELQQKFQSYHKIWQDHGFLVMYKKITKEEKIKENLSTLPDFERKITNLDHLAELINEKELKSNLKIQGILKFIEEQILNKQNFPEEYELRLENDERAVQILTVHKSKGLEFDIVFCPFLWSDINFKTEQISYHNNKNAILDFLPTDETKLLAQNEELSEKLRLAYVAMTRAKEKLYLAWGNLKDNGNSALSYLFHNIADAEVFKTISQEQFTNDLLSLADNTLIELQELTDEIEPEIYFPKKTENVLMPAKTFTKNLKPQWVINSFSSFQVNNLESEEGNLGGEVKTTPVKSEHNIYTFPLGAKTGICWHEIMQKLDFSNPNITQTVTQVLKKYNLSINPQNNESWVPVVSQMVEKTIKTFPVSQITEAKTLKELKFTFSASDKEISSLNLNQNKTAQFLTGIIDLIFEHENKFYIIDWKSNYLGDKPEDYNEEAIKKNMLENNYYLQAKIYELALQKYLKTRLPNYNPQKHFGGVYYVFLRSLFIHQCQTN